MRLKDCIAVVGVNHGITVNLVAPGAIQTDMVDSNNPIGSERRRQMNAMIPTGRIGRPKVVAEAATYFLSAAASYTTGQSLHVCGGWSLRVR